MKFKHLFKLNIVLMSFLLTLLVSILIISFVRQNDHHDFSDITKSQNDLKNVLNLLNKNLVMDEQILRLQSLSLLSQYDQKEIGKN